MNFLVSSLKSAWFLGSVLCTLNPTITVASSLDSCPLVTRLSTNQGVTNYSENDILDRFSITVSDGGSRTAPYNLYQKVGPNGKISLVLQLVQPSVEGAYPRPGDNVQVRIFSNPKYVPCDYTPLIYTVLYNVPNAYSINVSNGYGIEFRVPANYESAVVTIAQLGYVNKAQYQLTGGKNERLSYTFYSDIFSNNPLTNSIPLYSKLPENVDLITNEMSILQRIRHQLKKAARRECVPEKQIKDMAVAAFINEICGLFRCKEVCRPKPLCEQSIYVEYTTFITSCIKSIAYCEESKPAVVDFCHDNATTYVNRSCECVNKDVVCFAKTCGAGISGGVCAEISGLFSDVLPQASYEAICDVQVGIEAVIEPDSICDEELSSVSSSSSEDEEKLKKKKKMLPKKKAVVKTKTSMSYGVYIAAGVVIVSIAVVVYVFVL